MLINCRFRPVLTAKTGLFAVFDSQNPKDQTAGPVFSGLGPVQSRSFSSLETGPSNASDMRTMR